VSASFSGVEIFDNEARLNGGGIYVYKGMLDLDGVPVEGNDAGEYGGGILVYLAGLRAADSTVRGNAAALDGGGITTYSSISLEGVTVAHNTAGRDGGGINNSNGSTSWFTNTTFSGNAAALHGGGIFNNGRVSLRHVTLSGNGASSGGGLYNDDFAGVTAWLTNTIFADSTLGGNCFGDPLPARYSLDTDATCALTGTGNQSNLAALLSGLGDYGGPTWTHMLLPGSPALNGVSGSDAAPVDQRGELRPVGAYDIGAVERQADDSSLAARLRLPMIFR
jgi:hypothetical protein